MRWTAGLVLILVLSGAGVTGAQQRAERIAAIGGTIDVFDRAGRPIDPSQPLVEQERIRTGKSSFASLIVGPNNDFFVGEESEIEIRRLGPNPVIRLERGSLKVNSRAADIQIATASGSFSGREWPFAMEVTSAAGAISVVVTEGAIRTENLDTASVTFRAPANSGYRTYSAGRTSPRLEPAFVPPPNVFIQPCVTFGTPATPTAPVAPAPVPPPAPQKKPH